MTCTARENQYIIELRFNSKLFDVICNPYRWSRRPLAFRYEGKRHQWMEVSVWAVHWKVKLGNSGTSHIQWPALHEKTNTFLNCALTRCYLMLFVTLIGGPFKGRKVWLLTCNPYPCSVQRNVMFMLLTWGHQKKRCDRMDSQRR